jgi:hypothetical protein
LKTQRTCDFHQRIGAISDTRTTRAFNYMPSLFDQVGVFFFFFWVWVFCDLSEAGDWEVGNLS